jgi:catechol 2,3-dioxygenase-like lactoylglutathione lyase family enzyme
MEINGVAYTFITVGNFAAGRAFYGQLLPFLGLTVVADTVNTFYCVGGRTGFGIHAPAEEYVGQRFRQGSVGLHHHCFRARERADVDEAHDFLKKIGAHIVHAPQEDNLPPVTTRCCSRIRTAQGWRSIMSRARGCSRPEERSAAATRMERRTVERAGVGSCIFDERAGRLFLRKPRGGYPL